MEKRLYEYKLVISFFFVEYALGRHMFSDAWIVDVVTKHCSEFVASKKKTKCAGCNSEKFFDAVDLLPGAEGGFEFLD